MKNYIITKLLNRLIRSDAVKEEKAIYYRYGFTTLFEILSVQLLCIIWAGLHHQVPEYLAFYFSFVVLRKFGGGFHFKNFLPCFLTSILCVAAVLEVTRLLIYGPAASFPVCIAALVVIGLLSPVPSITEHWDTAERAGRRKKMWLLLLMFAVFTLLLYAVLSLRWLHLFMVTFIFMNLILAAGRLRCCYYRYKGMEYPKRV